MSNPTIGFIGYGNMAQAIAEGLVAAGAVNQRQRHCGAAHYDKLEKPPNLVQSGAYRCRSRCSVRHGRHRHQTVSDRKR